MRMKMVLLYQSDPYYNEIKSWVGPRAFASGRFGPMMPFGSYQSSYPLNYKLIYVYEDIEGVH